MSYANKLRVRANKLADIYIELNSQLKDFKKVDEEFYPIAHRLVNVAYEQLTTEARRNIESFNPRWSTIHNIREELTGKLNGYFNRNVQCTV
jgi:hypothetical protein